MILISACLVGENCRYDGKSSLVPELKKLVDDKKAIAICPEVLGGLPTPRTPCEIQKNGENIKVANKAGVDYTSAFLLGAQKTLEIAKKNSTKLAIMKSKSPSCGCGKIYDGTFTKTLIDGDGLTAGLLKENGIEVVGEEEFVD